MKKRNEDAGLADFTVEEVKALLGAVSSQLKLWDELDFDSRPEMRPIKPHLQSAFDKIEQAALRRPKQ